MGEFDVIADSDNPEHVDVVVRQPEAGIEFQFQVKSRERVTPQIADDLFERIASEEPSRAKTTLVFLAPTISDRVAEIARKHNISFLDYAGNCLVANERLGLLLHRKGFKTKLVQSSSPPLANVFSPKSSRIVRAMLSEPSRAWQVRELAEHPNVDVSMGLVSKVKHALLFQSYAKEENQRLTLKNPQELLQSWAKNSPIVEETVKFYVRGDTEEIEETIADWCVHNNHQYALARMSAAWRQAPDVRYNVANVYVRSSAVTERALLSLKEKCGARPVETGHNLAFLSPYDSSVFANHIGEPYQTSPLQTWLDLKQMSGRGEEAAEAVFEKHIAPSFNSSELSQ
ncbi:MAG: type IV toxin-antitoxin system AbiEi family antitoxin [Planctomycetota bacterium]